MNDSKKKSAKKNVSKLGHDPLAWINEDEVQSEKHPTPTTPSVSPSATESGAKKAVLTLPVYFGIAHSADVCRQMREILASGCSVVSIAAADVESLDAAGLQCLLAFSRQAQSQGVTLEWSQRSPKILEVSQLAGVAV